MFVPYQNKFSGQSIIHVVRNFCLTLSFSISSLLLFGQTKQLVLNSGFDFNLGHSENASYSNGNTTSSTSSNGVHFTFVNSIGTLVDKKDLISYGLILGLDYGTSKDVDNKKSKTIRYAIGAEVGKRRFIQFAPQLYYIPEIAVAFEYSRQRNASEYYPDNDAIGNQYLAHLDFIPFGMGFQMTPSLMTNFSIGNVRASFSKEVDWRENSGVNIKSKNTVFQLSANSSVFSIGIILFLNHKK